MNRRDTIIIATLVNAALVVVLFVTAKQTDKKHADSLLLNLPPKIIEAVPATTIVNKKQEKVENIEKSIVVPQKISKEELASDFAEKELIVKTTPQPVTTLKSPSQPSATEVSTPTEPKTQPNKEAYTTVIVKKGDFLERIAKANHTTVSVLMQLNDLSSTQLKIGQVIKVPVSDKQEEAKKARIALADDFYTVQEGDSPWTIALRNGIRLEDLLRMNDLDEQKARRLRPGDQLRIR